ncbi:MFS transporter [Nesterenkonia alba]|uniref:MFS transporter n=1 Tax=Nesterenkonia alba TaxID=515814 RepID=UPI0003B63AC9|nr:MFS transporter [Nesterenkonia alba]
MNALSNGRPRPLRRARWAAMAAFATNGALPASLLARYAEVKDALGLTPALFGLLVVGFGLGGALALHFPGAVSRQLGVARSASFGTVWMGGWLLLAVIGVQIGNPWVTLVGLVCAGAGDAVVDVAQNSQGIRVQQAYRRSLLNSMHAGWSIGAAAGGGVGTAAAVLGVPLTVHMAVWGAVCILVMAISARFFLPGAGPMPEAPDGSSGEEQRTTPAARPTRRRLAVILLPLVFVALAGISVEDIGNNWSAVLLSAERDMPASSAGIGLTVLLSAQFMGRMVGDRVIDWLGSRRTLVVSLAAVVAGLLGSAWAPTVALTLVGLALAGLGCAVTVPIAFARADAVPGLPDHSGVTLVSWAMRSVTLTLSPVIGLITELSALPVALSVVSLIAGTALILQLKPTGPKPS